MVLSDASPDLAVREGVLITQLAVILLCDWVQDPTLWALVSSPVMPEDLSNLNFYAIGVPVMVTGAEVCLSVKSMGKVNMRPVVSFKIKICNCSSE